MEKCGCRVCDIDPKAFGGAKPRGEGLAKTSSLVLSKRITLGLGDNIPGVDGKKGAGMSRIRPPSSVASICKESSATLLQAATESRITSARRRELDRLDGEGNSGNSSVGERVNPSVDFEGLRIGRDGVSGICDVKKFLILGIAGVGAEGEAEHASRYSTSPASMLSELTSPAKLLVDEEVVDFPFNASPAAAFPRDAPPKLVFELFREGELDVFELRNGLGLSRPVRALK